MLRWDERQNWMTALCEMNFSNLVWPGLAWPGYQRRETILSMLLNQIEFDPTLSMIALEHESDMIMLLQLGY